MPDDEIEKLVEKDKQTIKQASLSRDGWSPDLPEFVQYAFFALAMLFLVGMIAVLPWVGSGKEIPGRTWIGVGSAGLILFGGSGMAIELMRKLNLGSTDSRWRNERSKR